MANYLPINGKQGFVFGRGVIKKTMNCFLFIVFFIPASDLLGFSIPLSSNYLFVLYPLFIILATQKIITPSRYILYSILLYFIIFFIATLFQSEYYSFFDRRFASFVIFMAAFIFMFIRISSDQMALFKTAIVGASLIMLASPVLGFFLGGSNSFGAEAKGLFGSQRYGFMYLMAFWIVYLYDKIDKPLHVLIKYAVLIALFFGMVLTFSRSTIVAFAVTAVIYISQEVLSNKKSLRKKVRFSIYLAVSCFLIYLFIDSKAPYLIQFFDQRLFSIIFERGIDGFDLSNPEGSEGYRLYMLEKIVSFVALYPVTGSGYLGVWIMFSDLSGSAHNQYTDVLFRTGIIGLIIYVSFILKILNHFYTIDKGIFFGFLAVLVYGLFHETFKLSHGGFLFSFLLAVAFQKKERSKNSKVGRFA